jgi:two-component system NarL family response regulator
MHSDFVVSAGLRAMLSAASGVNWVAQERLEDVREGVIIADYHSGIAHGLKTCPSSRQRILLVAQDTKEVEVQRAMAAGIHGYLLHRELPAELTNAVLYLSNGQTYFGGSVRTCLLASSGHSELTKREDEVLQLLGQGYCNKVIARELGIGIGTVKTHIKSLLDKLSAATRTHAVIIAAQRGLFSSTTRRDDTQPFLHVSRLARHRARPVSLQPV